MFKPLNKNILVKLNNDENHTHVIYVGNNKTNLYKVLNIGKEVVEVKVNDIVYLNEEKLTSLIIDNTKYYVINENDIYMIIEE